MEQEKIIELQNILKECEHDYNYINLENKYKVDYILKKCKLITSKKELECIWVQLIEIEDIEYWENYNKSLI